MYQSKEFCPTVRDITEKIRMNNYKAIGALALFLGAAVSAHSQIGQPLVVTASNATSNQLLVYNASAQLIQTTSTHGQGGVAAGSNSGGIAVNDQQQVAVINYGSKSVSLFARAGNDFVFTQLIPSVSNPESVTFGHDHLYILGTTTVESHQMYGFLANESPDGMAHLLIADGSAAQVGVIDDQLVFTEKSNAIETVNLTSGGVITGLAAMVQNIPSNVNAPFGLVTRGNDAYVTIAHANEISLVRNNTVLTVTSSGTQSAPCWLALEGPFLFSSNSPSKSISRYAVYGQKIVQDAAVAASVSGNPTDIAYGVGMIAVIDGVDLSIFSVDEDGNLTRIGLAPINSADNGVAIVPVSDVSE